MTFALETVYKAIGEWGGDSSLEVTVAMTEIE